jgi:ABC-type methionine transport system ATPase subunit
MEAGAVAEEGTVDAVFTSPRSKAARELLYVG